MVCTVCECEYTCRTWGCICFTFPIFIPQLPLLHLLQCPNTVTNIRVSFSHVMFEIHYPVCVHSASCLVSTQVNAVHFAFMFSVTCVFLENIVTCWEGMDSLLYIPEGQTANLVIGRSGRADCFAKDCFRITTSAGNATSELWSHCLAATVKTETSLSGLHILSTGE